jgi:hypothetical protein
MEDRATLRSDSSAIGRLYSRAEGAFFLPFLVALPVAQKAINLSTD